MRPTGGVRHSGSRAQQLRAGAIEAARRAGSSIAGWSDHPDAVSAGLLHPDLASVRPARDAAATDSRTAVPHCHAPATIGTHYGPPKVRHAPLRDDRRSRALRRGRGPARHRARPARTPQAGARAAAGRPRPAPVSPEGRARPAARRAVRAGARPDGESPEAGSPDGRRPVRAVGRPGDAQHCHRPPPGHGNDSGDHPRCSRVTPGRIRRSRPLGTPFRARADAAAGFSVDSRCAVRTGVRLGRRRPVGPDSGRRAFQPGCAHPGDPRRRRPDLRGRRGPGGRRPPTDRPSPHLDRVAHGGAGPPDGGGWHR